MTETTVRDACDDLTVLYYKGCPQGFKFFGDDPEEHKSYINDTHIDICLLYTSPSPRDS